MITSITDIGEERLKRDVFAQVKEGNVRGVQVMLDEVPGAVTERDEKGNTPLHHAQNPAIAQMLIKSGADLRAVNSKGDTPEKNAEKRGWNEALKVLRKARPPLPKEMGYIA